jgi:cytochrome c-type biogenesis protein CcmH/NrfG
MTLADELCKLAELHANGGLTEDEFKRAKERLLNTEQSIREALRMERMSLVLLFVAAIVVPNGSQAQWGTRWESLKYLVNNG